MVPLNFRTTFLIFWHKIRCIVLNKKQKLFVKKNANHSISTYEKNTNHSPFMQFSVLMELHEKCMISIFPYMKIV